MKCFILFLTEFIKQLYFFFLANKKVSSLTQTSTQIRRFSRYYVNTLNVKALDITKKLLFLTLLLQLGLIDGGGEIQP